MTKWSFAAAGAAAAAILVILLGSADSEVAGSGAAAVGASSRYSMQAVGFDSASHTAVWIMNMDTGKVRVCGITYGEAKRPECTAEE